MPLRLYPQLHDREFLARTIHLSAEQLAAQLGCRPLTVEAYRRDHGLLQRVSWNPVHVELLTHFYGRFPVACIAQGLRRTRRAVYVCAHRLGLNAGQPHRATAKASARFWPAWRRAIRKNWPGWVARGLADHALGLLWRPASAFVPCEDCPQRSECRPKAPRPLRCERLTVREHLQYDYTEETG